MSCGGIWEDAGRDCVWVGAGPEDVLSRWTARRPDECDKPALWLCVASRSETQPRRS